MFIAVDETFEYNGRKYIAAKPPRHFWPCQNCGFYHTCGEDSLLPGFPQCQADRRADGRDVVFFECPDTAPRLQRRRRE